VFSGRTTICCLLSLFFSWGGVTAAVEIELELSKTECQPGEVVELRAIMSSEQLASFRLAIPEDPRIHFVANQKRPVHYRNGQYLQTEIWILQPKVAGVIQIEGIQAILDRPAGEEMRTLQVEPLSVLPYPDNQDNFAPELLPPVSEGRRSGKVLGILSLLTITVAGVLLARRFRREINLPENMPEQGVTHQKLRASLVAGENFTEFAEYLLNDTSYVLSPALRESLECLVYSPQSDTAAIIELLDREVSQ